MTLPPSCDVSGSSDPAGRCDGGSVIQTCNTGHTEEDAVQGGEEEELTNSEEDEEPYETGYDEDGGSTSNNEYGEADEEPYKFGDNDWAGKEYLAPVASSALDFLCFIAQPSRPRFDSVQNTAGFMRIVTAAADEANQNSGSESEIVVHYRYTLFSRAPLNMSHSHVSIRSGVKLYRDQFVLPSSSLAANPVSSLRLAGATVADIYPNHSRHQLHALWLWLVGVAPVTILPGTTRVEVTVDMGILKPGDDTPERVAHMLKALPYLARLADRWCATALGDVRAVAPLRLPAPVRCDDGVRPAKRRRIVVAEEDCAICYEVMRRGLAAWPRCAHIFHGECLEQLLVRGDLRCPLCRTEL